jgi:hypothetical protein
MDARKFASSYVKPENVRDGPIQTRVVNVSENERFGRPQLELETGSQLTLNESNTSELIKHWGHDTDAWIGRELELSLGTYRDWHTDKDAETVKVRAISPSTTTTAGNSGTAGKPPLPAPVSRASVADDLDDDLPFILAFFIISAVTWLVTSSSTLIA